MSSCQPHLSPSSEIQLLFDYHRSIQDQIIAFDALNLQMTGKKNKPFVRAEKKKVVHLILQLVTNGRETKVLHLCFC